MPDLVERFRAGEPEAVREVYREHAGAVHTVALSIVRNRDLAADVVQQTFVKAWRAARNFEGNRQLAPWLYAIARHTAIDVVRSESKPTRGGHAPETDVGVQPESFERTWERFEIRRAIDALPPGERDIVRLSHLDGYTHEAIAELLEIPIGTVKSRSNRAHRRLATALAHLAANQPPADDVLPREDP
ncbi:MAG: sigma-70 family RNA polymerase sigma factor [Ilumatobacter sp.]|nr:sigma-70 family RNA polymerase sigma factor [Ilumatobacter sp.]